MLRQVSAALAASLLLTGGAQAAPEPRPPAGGIAAYLTPSQTYGSARTVVHWVTRGPQAPPLNDDDGDAVPDYVEAVADTAELALTQYALRGFRSPPADTGGPDGRIDIYVSELPFGFLGAMLPPDISRDGSFLIVSSALDRREPVGVGSLKATVAHEVFHVVQHAYRFHHLPHWVLEGTADAMASLAVPDASDWLAQFGIARWVRAAATNAAENDPYGSAPWWTYLEKHDPGFAVELFTQRELDGAEAASTDRDAYALLDRLHRKRNGTSIDRRFQDFSAQLAAKKLLSLGVLARGERRVAQLGPFAIRAYRLRLPAGARTVTVEARGNAFPALQVILESGRSIVARGRRVRVSGDLANAMVVLTGRASQATRRFGAGAPLRLRVTLGRS